MGIIVLLVEVSTVQSIGCISIGEIWISQFLVFYSCQHRTGFEAQANYTCIVTRPSEYEKCTCRIIQLVSQYNGVVKVDQELKAEFNKVCQRDFRQQLPEMLCLNGLKKTRTSSS